MLVIFNLTVDIKDCDLIFLSDADYNAFKDWCNGVDFGLTLLDFCRRLQGGKAHPQVVYGKAKKKVHKAM